MEDPKIEQTPPWRANVRHDSVMGITEPKDDPPFQYRPLRPANEIRLIDLKPLEKEETPSDAGLGARTNPVRCTIKHAYLADAPPYTALSYVWGDQRAAASILLVGRPFAVTASLEAALRQLASDDAPPSPNISSPDLPATAPAPAPRYLWVDAICINQADTRERSAQVAQMGAIYARAAQTTIWLGPSTPSSALALRTLHHLDALSRKKPFKRIHSWSLFRFVPGAAPGTPAARVQRKLEELARLLCADARRVLRAVAELLERPWFRRVWVIQERALSAHPVMRCGGGDDDDDDDDSGPPLPFKSFRRAFWMLCGLRDYLHDAASGGGAAGWAQGGHPGVEDGSKVAKFLTARLAHATAVTIAEPRQPLLHLLALLVGCGDEPPLQASDARDYVFALLGLAGRESSPDVRADYSKGWGRVRVEVAKACLMHYGLEVLSFCSSDASASPDTEDASGQGTQHCSWAPDWGSKRLPRPFCVPSRFVVRGGNRRSAYRASGSSHQDLSETSFFRSESGQHTLRLSAIFVDTVSRLGVMLPTSSAVHDEDEDRTNAVVSWLKDLERLLPPETCGRGSEAAYDSPEKRQDALWRTPVADRAYVHNYDSVRATHETWLGYQAAMGGVRGSTVAATAEGIKYVDIARYKLHARRPFRTEKGRLAIGPGQTLEGDCIWIFPGADVPFVLRQVGGGRWSVVGEAYVHGIMDGEVIESDPGTRLVELI